MSPLDMTAIVAGWLAFGWLAIRANMLKPRFRDWCSAPTLVWASLLVLGVICAIVALSIMRTGVAATPREAMLLIGIAFTALVMLINLHLQAAARGKPPTD